MLDVTTINNPSVAAFEQKIPGMFVALVKHETIAVQEVVGRYARNRFGDVPLDLGSEIDLAVVTAIAVPVLANALITSGAADLEAHVAQLVDDMAVRLRDSIPLILAKVAAATGQAERDIAAGRGLADV